MHTDALRPLAIIKVGDAHDALREAHGDFEQWIARGLGDTPLKIQVFDPRAGQPLPEAQQISAAIVTGSHAMVSHREEWSQRSAAWLGRLVARGAPVLGICFGHQLLAHALGGRVDDHPRGMEVGTRHIVLAPAAREDALLRGLPQSFEVQSLHRQSALRLPVGAVLLAGNEFDPHQIFRVGARAWGVQFHPEFDEQAMRAYVERTAETLRAQGEDPAECLAAVRPTPTAATLLRRFARLVEEREPAVSPTAR